MFARRRRKRRRRLCEWRLTRSGPRSRAASKQRAKQRASSEQDEEQKRRAVKVVDASGCAGQQPPAPRTGREGYLQHWSRLPELPPQGARGAAARRLHARARGRDASSPPWQLPRRCTRLTPGCRPRFTQPRSPCLRRGRCRGAVATTRVLHGRTGAVRVRALRPLPAAARARRSLARAPPRADQRGCRAWTARDGGGHLWGGAEAAAQRSRPCCVSLSGARSSREIGAVCSPDRLRGSSGWPVAGQVVVPGHAGSGC